jgi:HD superfamily phosphohydrolase
LISVTKKGHQMKRYNRIRTVQYGDQKIYRGELELLHTPSFQRLYDLHQLGLADRVYIDASHSRLHHVVGVLEQAERLSRAIVTNLRAHESRKIIIDGIPRDPLELAKDVEDKIGVVRLIGLLHDLTHAPFGHTLEDEIRLFATKHDDPGRQAEAFYRVICEYIAWMAIDAGYTMRISLNDSAPKIPEGIIRSSFEVGNKLPQINDVVRLILGVLEIRNKSLPEKRVSREREELVLFLGQLRLAMTGLLYLDLLHKEKPDQKDYPSKAPYDFQLLIDGILGSLERSDVGDRFTFRPREDAYMLDIIGNTVCADLLDYAHRDAQNANIRFDYDGERIAENFTLAAWDRYHDDVVDGGAAPKQNPPPNYPFEGRCIRTAISLFSHKFRIDVPSELMNLLNNRYYIHERVLYHTTKCAGDAMLGTACQLIGWRPLRDEEVNTKSDFLPPALKSVGDQVFLHDIYNASRCLLYLLKEYEPENIQYEEIARSFKGLGATIKDEEIATAFKGLSITSQGMIVDNLIHRWDKFLTQEAFDNIDAGLELLERLFARRYYRQVFRLLPDMTDVGITSYDIAERFSDPQVRYKTERQIEAGCKLPIGSIVIHCPRRKTSQKVANVLLVLSKKGGVERVVKLRNIARIEDEIFADHEQAIKAVEKMYGSMWKLIVYVRPNYMAMYQSVGQVIGRVLADTFEDRLGKNSDAWPNDTRLIEELDIRIRTGEQTMDSNKPEEESALNILSEISKASNNPGLQYDLKMKNWRALRIGLEFYLRDDVFPADLPTSSLDDRFTTAIKMISSRFAGADDYNIKNLSEVYKTRSKKLSPEAKKQFQNYFFLRISKVLQTKKDEVRDNKLDIFIQELNEAFDDYQKMKY